MKHKEQGYRLFRDDHVKMVRFHPGDSSANQCIFYAQGKPSMKITGCYSTVVTPLAMSLVHTASVKQEQVDAVSMLLHCCITSLTMLNSD